MLKENYSCTLNLANDLIGGKWKMRILWHISIGHNHFSMLRQGIPEITHKVLTEMLRQLETDKLLSREVILDAVPIRVDYSLTEYGRAFMPALNAVNSFVKEYAAQEGIPVPLD